MRKIFISHSSRDLELTKTISRYLEQLGRECWYSERDLDKTKSNWQQVLLRSINESHAIILVVTRNSLKSGEVLNEISNASAQNRLIVPYLVENIPLTEQYMYLLRKYEWLPAYSMPQDDALALLARKVSATPRQKALPTVEVPVNGLLCHENPCFSGIHNGSFGIGFNKCLVSNGGFGWHPDQVFIEEVDREEFTFASIGHPELDREYEEFCNTGIYRKMETRGDNRTRWMLSELYQNDSIFLSLRKTRWSRTTFWWNQVRDQSQMQQKLALHTFHNQSYFFPNSLCLHLIVETADDMLVCTRISRNKKNDYASTIAVTIGEQLNEQDFSSGETNNNQFLYEWCRRALFEEFGFTDRELPLYVQEDSIRLLGINYEGDIYNFALPVYIRLNLTFNNLKTYLSSKNVSSQEFTEVLSMTSEEILQTLQQVHRPEVSCLYHPSSFLRMLQYLNHRCPQLLEV